MMRVEKTKKKTGTGNLTNVKGPFGHYTNFKSVVNGPFFFIFDRKTP